MISSKIRSIVTFPTTTTTTTTRTWIRFYAFRTHNALFSSSSASSSSSSTTTTTTTTTTTGGERLRVAIVGGGCAGMSCALHLAPLVERGYIASPIDLYTYEEENNNHHHHNNNNNNNNNNSSATTTSSSISSNPQNTMNLHSSQSQQQQQQPPYHRDIGVGIWSTALEPFHFEESNRQSHQHVYQQLIQSGSWIEHVGYRTPNGSWLMKSHLPIPMTTTEPQQPQPHNHNNKNDMPSLLFVREKDLFHTLSTALHWEQQQGLVQIYHGQKVTQLLEQSNQPWSTSLVIGNNHDTTTTTHTTTNNNNDDDDQQQQHHPSLPFLQQRDYHMIIAADGTHSLLRQQYGGHDENGSYRTRITGTDALLSTTTTSTTTTITNHTDYWNELQRQTGIGLQDRNYTVYRGNAVLSRDEMEENDDHGTPTSFQTWGTKHSMRFASVPMIYPIVGNQNNNNNKKEEERQVWFITIDDSEIENETDPIQRKNMLLNRFQDWHDPIQKIIQATDPNEIVMNRAIAHRYATSPVLNFNHVVERMRGIRPPNSGTGPCIVFVGDAYMTVDPILAQGFTVGMEGAYVLKKAIEKACVKCEQDPSLDFDPYKLQHSLRERNQDRMNRLVCLLRVTELVQALGQPTGNTWSGHFQTKILRPIIKLIPNFIKAPIFDQVLKYSLGITPFRPKREFHHDPKK